MKSGLETYSERQIESLKAVIAEQQERIGELEAEVERLRSIISAINNKLYDAPEEQP